MKKLLAAIGVLSSYLFSTLAIATPVLLFDSGKTVSITPYTDAIQVYNPKKVKPITVFNPLPVETPNLSPGKVVKRRIDQPYLSNPMFLIGNDRLSYQWLVSNKELLKRINAIGMLVNVKTMKELRYVESLAKGLKIIPASAIDLAKQLGIKHYPVLISKQFIEQ